MMKILISIIVALVLVSSGVYYFYPKELTVEVNSNIDTGAIVATSSLPVSNATTTGPNILNVGGVEYELVEAVVSTSTINKLNLNTLNKKLIFPSNSPAEINKKYEIDVGKIVSILEEKPENFDKWIELGIYRKNINDYEGAMEAWVNATIIQPGNALPESNIGNLLGYYMKDPVNAEKHYLRSIELEPNVGFWYYQTFMFYKEVVKDEEKGKAIIEKGVKNNPADTELAGILKDL